MFVPQQEMERLFGRTNSINDVDVLVDRGARREPIIREITEKLSTEEVGDGKIFVYDVNEVVRIRTGERGEVAL